MQTETPESTHDAVSTADVQHIAALASLQLTAEETPRMVRDLNSVLSYIAELNQLDTAGVAPMTQVGEALGLAPLAAGEPLRRDIERASVDRAAVMQQAPETDGRFFKVPKVIER